MLALIAGQGALPSVLVQNLSDQPLIAALEGFAPEDLVPDRVFRIEQLGTLIEAFKACGVTEVCFAGSIARPAIDPSRIDAATMPLVPRMMAALQKGDDGALREVLSIFEDAGMKIRAAHEIAPALLPTSDVRSKRQPDDQNKADTEHAAANMAALGPLDIGQSCVVRHHQTLAIEGQFGTDWMLNSLQNRPDGTGGVLYKAAKPDQDRRIDLPVIGAQTIAGAKKAGLDGVVIETGGVMVLDLDRVIGAADENGLFLWIRGQ